MTSTHILSFGLLFSYFDDTFGGACVVGGSRHQPSRRQHAQELLQVASDHQSRDGRPSQPSRRGHSSYQVIFSPAASFFLSFFFFPFCFRNSQRNVARWRHLCSALMFRRGLPLIFCVSTCCHYFAFLFLSLFLTLAFCLHPAGTTFAPASTNRAAH